MNTQENRDWSHVPEIRGPRGCAWSMTIPDSSPAKATTVAMWLLNCPGAHPFWNWWVVSLVHLRPAAGFKAPNLRDPKFTHEVLVLALDPQQSMPDPKTGAFPRYLTPIDVAEQFEVTTDEQAAELCRLCILSCCEGSLSPDQDYRSAWNASVQATAEHLRTGGHGEAPDGE